MNKNATLAAIVVALLVGAGLLGYFSRQPVPEEHAMTGADGGGSDLVNLLKRQEGEIRESDVRFATGEGKDAAGFLAEPAAPGKHPAIVLIHEWWGLNDSIKEMARALAKEGYVVLAVDMFGKVAATPEEARAQTGALSDEAALAISRGALAYLEAHPAVAADRIASFGWCYGGGRSFQLGIAEPGRLAATVIYYGKITDDAKTLAALRQPVFGVFGADDQSIPKDLVERFDATLAEIGAEHEVYVYPDAGHAFANPTNGAAYRPEAAADAWVKTVAFLKKHLGND